MRGGYKIVDLGGKNIATQSSTNVSGLYEILEGSTKPILLEGIVIDNQERKPGFINPTFTTTNAKFAIAGYTWTVDEDDDITLVAVQ